MQQEYTDQERIVLSEYRTGNGYEAVGDGPISDNFVVMKRSNNVELVNAILSNVQKLVHYLEFAHSKGVFSLSDSADIYASIMDINKVTDNLEK